MATATIRISGPFAEDLVAAPRPATPWYRRLLNVLIEARMAQAAREIERHGRWTENLEAYRHITPSALEAGSVQAARAGQLSLPFNRD
ncbi:MAG: hypothetical protein AB7K64_03095 [Variibacter sp.]